MRSLTLLSPAKLNLYLKVVGRRTDGYHELVTLFQQISLKDRLTLKKIKSPRIRLITNHPSLQNVQDNIIFKAHQLLRKTVSWKGGVEVRLEKKIPIGAGLGGGSSNAAYFLIGMNRLLHLKLSFQTLLALGFKLGSDVPFFLYQTSQAIATGRGEQLKPLISPKKLWFVIVVPPFGISTRMAYQHLKARRLTRITHDATISSDFFRSLYQKRKDGLFLPNDLFKASSSLKPELKKIDRLLVRLGSKCRSMSGSGSAMFSVHHSKAEAEQMARAIRRQRLDLNVFVS